MTVPIGTILPYAGLVDGNARGELQRQGWLICDGEEYLEEDYPELENTIGTIYGNSRPGSFKVPDLRGRFVRGVDAGAGRDPDVGSRSGGHEPTKLGSVQGDRANSIDKLKTNKGEPSLVYGKENTVPDNGSWSPKQGTAGNDGAWTYIQVKKKGGETRPTNICVNWIIKAKEV